MLVGGNMSDKMGDILEKLNFDRMLRPQIDLMWKVIKKYYISSNDAMVRYHFSFPNKWVQFPEIEDFSGVNMQIPRKYDFNKAKRLFIKEPWVVFCVDSNEAYFDFTKDSIRKEFFERLDYTVYGNYLSWAKKDFPTVHWFLVNVMGYNDSDQFSVVQRYDTEKIKDYPVGRELFDKAWEMLERGLLGKEVVPPHRMGWIDGNLCPMFIWDTQEGFVYSCNISSDQLNLDRRSLNKRTIVKVKDSRFMDTDLSQTFPRKLGLVNNRFDSLWVGL